MLIMNACQSVEQLSIDYMLPAEVSFPASLKRVAVVNNMPDSPENASPDPEAAPSDITVADLEAAPG